MTCVAFHKNRKKNSSHIHIQAYLCLEETGLPAFKISQPSMGFKVWRTVPHLLYHCKRQLNVALVRGVSSIVLEINHQIIFSVANPENPE